MTELFTLTGTAVDRLGEVLEGLEVHPARCGRTWTGRPPW